MVHAGVLSRSRRRYRALGTAAALIGSLLVTGVFARSALAATGSVTEFTLPSSTTPPTSGPQNIAVGADGNIWFTIQNSDQIGNISPTSPSSISVFNVPTLNSQPNGIALGPDGNIWFTEFNAGKIGEITPGGTFSEYLLPAGSASGPRNIALGPDGNMWFTEYNANKIGRIIPSAASNGTMNGVTEYPLLAGTNPRGIIAGPDGNIWFTEFTANFVGYINPSSPTTAPVLISVPTSSSGPRSIDVGPNGYLWFTENNTGRVGKVLAASPNTITDYATPTAASVPARMTEGPDGNMWFSENGVSQIASINPTTNVITEYGGLTTHSNPVGVITGPDHNIWFTENGVDKIGQLAVVLPTTTTLGSSSNPSQFGNSITLTATVSPASATGTVTFEDGGTSIGTGTVSSGTATLPISTLTFGSHNLTAVYGGDSFNTTSTSTPALVQVVQTVSGIGLGSSKNPSTVGDSVTFTATVTPPSATGTVTFLDGATSIGTGTLSGGVATLATTTLAPGSHSVTAFYPGDTDDTSGTSAPVSQVVNQIITTTALGSGPNPSQNGQSVTFTATVNPNTATGTVTFYDGSTNLGSGTLSTGTATLNTSSLSVGTHSITATYNGDTNDAVSTSTPALSQVVNPGNTSTVVGSGKNPSTFGDSVTFSATVTPATASGTVTFYDGAVSIGSGTLISGSTTLTTSLLSGGSHNITAVYGGDGSNDGSTSNLVVQGVNPAATTVGLGTSGTPSTFGDSVTFTATVSPATASGTVTFYDGATNIGSGPLSSGKAALATSTLSGGDHNITASYGGDSNDAGNTSSILIQHVNAVDTSTGVGSSANPSSNGASVTFTATVSPATATGTVTFYDGLASLGTGSLSSGTATLTTSALGIGSHSITAGYGGDTNDTGSTSSALTQVVQAVTATGLGSSLNPSQLGQAVTLTATVSPSTASGSVTFYDGSTSIGSGTLSGDTATLGTSTLAVGSHSITAVYSGDAGDTTSTSTPLTQVVNADTTSTVVTSSANPSQPGQSVTLTATVTPLSATGTVTFKDGATSLATERVTAGVGTFPTTTLAVGSHSITAVYSGDANDVGGTSSPMTQVVSNASTTTTTLTSSANPAKVGTKVTFTATVSPSSATGKVTFKDGTTKLGTATLKKGVATFSTTTLALGTHQITATYAGDSKHPGSKSAKLAEKIVKKIKVVVGPVQTPLTAAQPVSIDLIGRRLVAGSY